MDLVVGRIFKLKNLVEGRSDDVYIYQNLKKEKKERSDDVTSTIATVSGIKKRNCGGGGHVVAFGSDIGVVSLLLSVDA